MAGDNGTHKLSQEAIKNRQRGECDFNRCDVEIFSSDGCGEGV